MELKEQPGGLVAALAQTYPAAGAEFTVVLERGERFRFRQPRSMAELHSLRAAAASAVERYKARRVPPQLAEFCTGDDTAYFYVSVLAALCTGCALDGGGWQAAPSESEWLELSAKLPSLVDTIRRHVDEQVTVTAYSALAADIEQKKTASGPTSSTATGSSSPETSGGSTPTNSMG